MSRSIDTAAPSVSCFSAPVSDTADPGPDAAVAVLADLGFEFGPAQPVVRSWLDTFDGRLAAAGARLDARPVYKPGSAEAVELSPHGTALPDRPLVVAQLPRLPEDLPAGQFRLQLATLVGNRALLVQLTLHSSCAHAILRNPDGKAVARVELHTDLELFDGDGRPRPLGGRTWCLELHVLVDPGAQGARRKRSSGAHRRLMDLGLDRRPADVLVWAAEAGEVSTDGRPPTRTRLRRRDRAQDAWRDVLHDLGDAVEAVWDGAAGDVDAEFLHDLRTALRRARSVLRHADRVLPEHVRQDALDLAGSLADRTGLARDLDVLVASWASLVDGLDPDDQVALEPVHALLERRRRAAHLELATALDQLGRVAWCDRWHALVDTTRDRDGERPSRGRRRVGVLLAGRLERAHRRLVRDARALDGDSPAESWHELRKDAKRLRYLVESFGSLVAGTHRREYVRRLKLLLDHLGAQQDEVVRQQQLAAVALETDDLSAATCAALRVLADRAGERAAELRDESRDAVARFDRTGTRRALERVLEDLRR